MFRSLANSLLQSRLSTNTFTQIRGERSKAGILPKPRKRNPFWFVRQQRTVHEDYVTADNRNFVEEVVSDRFGALSLVKGVETYASPVKQESLLKVEELPKVQWVPNQRRCGILARKIGVVPLWKKDGKKIMTTMLQVEDNHVIKYYKPEEFEPTQKPRVKNLKKFGCLLVGACSSNPSKFTKEYCGLFKDSGVMPKQHLSRFLVTPSAQLLPGTPLNVTHFRVGDYVDVRGKTVDRGFQGVMKRWGFHGMPATHGVTKTHRRPGNIGSGGEKARVWKGQKMPGHMGNRYRKLKGLKVWRINTEFNVMWVSGKNIPGENNNFVQVFDTMLPLKRRILQPPFPTNLDEPKEDPADTWSDELHNFKDPTIFYEVE